MTVLLHDTFTGAAGPLSGHTSDSSHAWSNTWGDIGGTTRAVLDGAGNVSENGNGTVYDVTAGDLCTTTTGSIIVTATLPAAAQRPLDLWGFTVMFGVRGPTYVGGSTHFAVFTIICGAGVWKAYLGTGNNGSSYTPFYPTEGVSHQFEFTSSASGLSAKMDGATILTLAPYGGWVVDLVGTAPILQLQKYGSVSSVMFLDAEGAGPPPVGPAFWTILVDATEKI